MENFIRNATSDSAIYEAPEQESLRPVGVELVPLLSLEDAWQSNQTATEARRAEEERGEGEGLGVRVESVVVVCLLSVLPLVTVVCGVVTCAAVTWDRRLHHTLFYFSSSLSVQQILVAVVAMPPAILVTWHGQSKVHRSKPFHKPL